MTKELLPCPFCGGRAHVKKFDKHPGFGGSSCHISCSGEFKANNINGLGCVVAVFSTYGDQEGCTDDMVKQSIAEWNTRTQTQPIDVGALKREVADNIGFWDATEEVVAGKFIKQTIDHLASRGYLRTPVKVVEGLDSAIDNLKDASGKYCQLNDKDIRDLRVILEAARLYHAMQKGAKE